MSSANAPRTPSTASHADAMSKSEIALRNLSVDLGYLSTPHSSDETPPSHIYQVFSAYERELPKTNPFLLAVASVPSPACIKNPINFAKIAEHDAIRKDISLMLQVLHQELGGTPELQGKIDALKASDSDELLASSQSIVMALQRNVIASAQKGIEAMHQQSKEGLWSRTQSTEHTLAAHFHQADQHLAEALTLFDSGDVGSALKLYSLVMHNTHDQISEFASASNTDFYLKFGAGLGILTASGLATAYTGGATLYVATGSAVVTETTGIVAFTGSLLVGGATFTASQKFLSHQIFNVPYFASHGLVENALEFTGSSLKTAALMGYLRGFGEIFEVPAYAGTGAKGVNFGTTLTRDFAGMTSFTGLTEGPSEAFAPETMANTIATLLGLKGGAAAIKGTITAGKSTVDAISDLRVRFGNMWNTLGTEEPAGYPLLMLAATKQGQQITEGGLNVFSKLGDLYFGKGQLPLIKKIPLYLIGFTNIELSFIGANAVRSLVERASGAFHSVMPSLFNEVTADKFSPFLDNQQWWNTTWMGSLSLISLLGIGILFPRISNGSSPLKSYPKDVKVSIPKQVGWYFWEVIARGVMGAIRLAGDRHPGKLKPLTATKDFLQSRPLSNVLAKTNLPIAAQAVVAKPPDAIFNFMGRIMPDQGVRFVGFTADILLNSAVSYMNATIMETMKHSGNSVEWQIVGPTFVVTALMAFANTQITQHQGFDPAQALGGRTVFGVAKGWLTTGLCSTNAVTPATNYSIQSLYGLFTMYGANWITSKFPTIGPIKTPKPSLATSLSLDAARRELALAQVRNHTPTVVVVDAGMGSLSVFDDLVSQFRHGPFAEANIVYHNALTALDRGFNGMSESRQALHLDRVLHGIETEHEPDLVIIPDHTLSSILPRTQHGQASAVPILTTTAPTVDMIVAGLKQYPNAKVVMMGSPVTVQSGRYQEALATRGIPSSRVLTESCPTLGREMETFPTSPETDALIAQHAKSIAEQLKDRTTPVIVSINNTHIALAADRIRAALTQQGLTNVTVLDPSKFLTQGLFNGISAQPGVTPKITASMVSQVNLSTIVEGHLMPILDRLFPEAAAVVRASRSPERPIEPTDPDAEKPN